MKKLTNDSGVSLPCGRTVWLTDFPRGEIYDIKEGDRCYILFGPFAGAWVAHGQLYGSQWTGSYRTAPQWRKDDTTTNPDEVLSLVDPRRLQNPVSPEQRYWEVASLINGGPAGVDKAGPLNDLLRQAVKKYHGQ